MKPRIYELFCTMWWVRVLFLGCGIAVGSVATAAPAPLLLQRLASGVYAYIGDIALMDQSNEGAIANLGVIIGDKGIAVVDTGGSVLEGRRFLAAIRKISQKPILYVINTHVHPDHIFGNAAFLGLGATFVGHKNLPQVMAAQAPYYLKSFAPAMGAALLADVQIVPPTLLVQDTLKLDLGNRPITLQSWAASHTDTDISVEDETSKTLIAGDLLFVEHIPVIDNSVLGYVIDSDALAHSDAKIILPGHGPVPANWRAAVANQRAYFETLETDLRADLKQGIGLANAVQDAAQTESGKWKLFGDYNARNATTAYAELEWN